jgi:low affinity Fe/Cu permease
MLKPLRKSGDHLSTLVSNVAANAFVQLAVLVGCVAWLLLGHSEAVLASALTIGGFILTQMVLNQQRRRENALHLKIDELLVAAKGARSELAGTEHATADEIERLREGRDADDADQTNDA